MPALSMPTSRSSRILAIGTAGAVLAAVPAVGLGGGAAILFDNLQQLGAATAATLAVALAPVPGTSPAARVRRGVLAALGLTVLGMATWDLLPGGSTTVSPAADLLFAVAIGTGALTFAPAIFGGLDRWAVAGVALDATLLFLTGVNVVAAIWWSRINAGLGPPEMLGFLGAVVLVAGSGAAIFALVARRIPPSASGPWAALAGLSLSGFAWIAWMSSATRGVVTGVAPVDFLLSGGLLLVAYGTLTWSGDRSAGSRYERAARIVATSFPILAILLSVVLDVMSPRIPLSVDVVAIGTGTIVLVAAARQSLLLYLEQRARAAERLASARLEREIEERAETVVVLSRLEPGHDPEQTAGRICDEALRLEGIDVAVIHAWSAAGSAHLLAERGMGDEQRGLLSRPLSREHVEHVMERARLGPWVDVPEDGDSHTSPLLDAGLLCSASAPLHWDDRVIGAIGVGTRSPEVARTLHERLPTIRELAVVASALLGPGLAARERTEELRAAIRATIDERAFGPVFQPIVDIRTGASVGFEALTRFDDGCPPDRRFADAAAAGMSIPLETVTLRAALDEASALPRGTWLSLNVSPAFATALLPLLAVLEGAERDVVIEITEHVAIEDYERLLGAISLLGADVRIAVDDAGAGYASLRHILELRPQFLKLDVALVHSIDADPVRRALVTSFASFARDTGCAVIAEGVQTSGELGVLRELGVELGQGYLLGVPQPAAAFAVESVESSTAPPARAPHRAHTERDRTAGPSPTIEAV